MYNLHAVTNPETFDEVPSNTCGYATSVLITALIPTPPCVSAKAWSCACSTTSCF